MEDKKINIQAICDGDTSSATTWMQGLAKYSKHKIEILQWSANPNKKPDLIYFTFGSLIHLNEKIVEQHPEIKYGLCVMGAGDFAKIVGWGKVVYPYLSKLSGAIVLGTRYDAIFKKYIKDVPTYICDIAVDTTMFVRKPSPEHFVIGYAENSTYPPTDSTLNRFLGYGFPVIMAGSGKGVDKNFIEMPGFYESISVFADSITDPRPGGLMFLEAGAVGRPVVCMRKGIMADWFPPEFLAEDDADMVKKLTKLRDEPEYYNYASTFWHELAKSRDYSIIVKDYDAAFEAMMK